MKDSTNTPVYAVTGAGSGIGLATVKLLLDQGARVSACDINEASLDEFLVTLQDSSSVYTQKVDVRKREEVDEWMAQTISKFGRLDGAANLAGVIPKYHNVSNVVDQDDADWDFTFDVNTRGVMVCLRAQLAHIRDGGSIVNAGSALSLQGRGAAAAYSASKHAVVGLTRCAAKEVGERAVRVNCIAPGYVMTPMLARAQSNQTKAGQENPGATALGRFGKPEEVANVVWFLLSNQSSFITGATICVDGGWNC